MAIKPPKWREQQEEVDVPYLKLVWGPFKLEGQVDLKVNGHSETIHVPRDFVNEIHHMVKGAITADLDDDFVLVAFAPTSLGSYAIRIKKSLLKYPVKK